MIGSLSGTVVQITDDTAIIDVGGVGYEVSATPRHLGRLAVGNPARMAVETQMSENQIRLIAFETEAERRAFRMLQSVQGVGMRAALNILQVLTPAALFDAIALGDKTALTRAAGVGPKLGLRIITELKDRAAGALGTEAFRAPTDSAGPTHLSGARADANLGLAGLGYDEASVRRALASLPVEDAETAATLIRRALKFLSTA